TALLNASRTFFRWRSAKRECAYRAAGSRAFLAESVSCRFLRVEYSSSSSPVMEASLLIPRKATAPGPVRALRPNRLRPGRGHRWCGRCRLSGASLSRTGLYLALAAVRGGYQTRGGEIRSPHRLVPGGRKNRNRYRFRPFHPAQNLQHVVALPGFAPPRPIQRPCDMINAAVGSARRAINTHHQRLQSLSIIHPAD